MLRTNSKQVVGGDTFVAVKGSSDDGHKYIEEAIKNGATKIVAEYGLYSVETLIVESTTEYIERYIASLKNELEQIKLIGVTGTNGKTTTCYLLWQALNKLGYKCAYIGTIGFYLDDKVMDLSNTTPGNLELCEMILEAKNNGFEYVVMEVSSHALDQDRVYGLSFDVGIITNVTEDHLDYHKTMESYSSSKQKLFNKIKDNGYAIVPAEIDYREKFLIKENRNISYGLDGDYKIEDIVINEKGSNFILKRNKIIKKYHINLIGMYNIYNVINVIIILEELLVQNIEDIINDLVPPPGRMEMIGYNDSTIIIDYAHTPDAVENVIKSVREISKGSIYTIIGCGGNRDKLKRPIMANVATKLSDYVIFTSDNPRYENPDDIISDMIRNLENNNYEIEINREKAIIKGIQKCNKNDILLILGKGHETYQVIKNKKIHFDDKEIVLEYIRR